MKHHDKQQKQTNSLYLRTPSPATIGRKKYKDLENQKTNYNNKVSSLPYK